MSNKQQTNSDFQDRYFDLIQSSLSRLEDKIEHNTDLTEQVKKQAEKTNGRVGVLEKEVFGKIKPSELPTIWKDPKVIAIVFNLSLAILVLVVAATKVDITKFLP